MEAGQEYPVAMGAGSLSLPARAVQMASRGIHPARRFACLLDFIPCEGSSTHALT